jgi:hypothetical protein
MPIKVNCSFCEKELFREPKQAKNNQHHYCDRKCLANSKKNTQEIACKYCGTNVSRPYSQIKKNITGNFFCRIECRSQYSRKSYKVKCVVCGIDFDKLPSEQKRYPIHCCSTECRSKNNDKRKFRTCDECGNKISRPPSVLKDRNNIFCSQKCFDIFQNQKTEVKCEKCGKKVFKSPSAMKERHYFCSRECFSKYAFSESFVETEFEKLVKKLSLPYLRNDRQVLYGCAKNGGGLELDFYFPTIKFAVEINGVCHYKPVYGEEALAGQKIRDSKKRKRCKELGIILRVIKPGDCKRETYMPRYKRVVWEIKKEINNGIS